METLARDLREVSENVKDTTQLVDKLRNADAVQVAVNNAIAGRQRVTFSHREKLAGLAIAGAMLFLEVAQLVQSAIHAHK